jgi:transcriptional regulator GlxA family with amidase domain
VVRLLEVSGLSVGLIAGRAGLAAGASPRRHLRVAIGVASQTYRRTFEAVAR